MESLSIAYQDPASIPSSELWGRDVCDPDGHRVGTIDSITRTYRGRVQAIVRTGKRPQRFVFVNLDGAVIVDDAVIVSSAVAVVESRPGPWSQRLT
jgi:sporulation protein YlmC with PRC-barrel domain